MKTVSRDPFKIDGPTCISFSGGRTSAYMLWRVLQANSGIPDEAIITFANTGKEALATLDFIRDCAANWSVPIVWLEFMSRAADGFAVVDHESASRKGEPFDRLIEQKQRLPNVVQRACTEELKVKTIDRYLTSIGAADAETMVGVRADEPHRIPRLRARNRVLPLVDAFIGKRDVHSFWRAQTFDLDLPYEEGHGNCDLCFLKTPGQIMARIKEVPQRAVWWATKERDVGARFHKDRPSYQSMADFARDQRDMFDTNEEAIPCFCGD
jgi:3'-phosphoadenosine 5'-phosphosulfate sulfotransferase (PAPS reductase)/FAD synthetase